MTTNYSADITAGSLLLTESRKVAKLLLDGASAADFQHAIIDGNLLQTSSPLTAKRISRLIRNRLDPMGPGLWKMIHDGVGTTAVHATLAAAIGNSSLLGDFLNEVVRHQHEVYATQLPKLLWDDYIQTCKGRDPSVATWRDSTCIKCRNVIYQILAQAKYIDSTRSLRLQQVSVAPEVAAYLQRHDMFHILRCMQVTT